jgi:hypothetical protein
MIEDKKAEAQETLDELFNEDLIPFELSARKLDTIAPDEHRIRFYDSRLHSVVISCSKGLGFKKVFRAAILDRVKRMSGPLYKKFARECAKHFPKAATVVVNPASTSIRHMSDKP